MKLTLCIVLSMSVFIVQFPQIASAQTVVDECRVVAELLGRDESQDVFDMKVRDTVYSQMCSGKTAKAGLDFNSNSTAIVDLVPLSSSLGLSGRKEKTEYICSTYQSSNSIDLYKNGLSSTVVRESVEAWRQCVVVNKDVGIRVLPITSPGVVFIELKRGAEDAWFNGIKVQEGSLTCSATYPDNGVIANRPVDANVHIPLSATSLNVTCSRGMETARGGFKYMPQTTFLIDTTRGSMPVVMPQDASLGPAFASQLVNDAVTTRNRLQAEIDKLNGRTIVFERHCTALASMCGGGPTPQGCSAGFSHAFNDVFTYTGGSCGIGSSCNVCYKFVDPAP